MAQVSSVDYDAKRIHLHSDTVVNGFDVIAAHFEINALVKANANGEQNRAACLSAEGRIPKGGGKFTPRYGLLKPGWRIVPYNGVSHVLAINVEVLSPDLGGLSGRDVFDRTPLPPSIEVQIDHNWDQVEVIEVNTGAVSVDYGLIATSVHSELSGDLGILDGKLNTIVTATTSTIPTAISSLHNFNPATDVVARVALVDVTTLNSDMRGTDGANTTVPPTVTEIVTGMDSTSTQLTALVNASGSIATQISNLHDFDPANDDVARVLNVTTNDDMRGTDNVDVTNLNIALGHITDLYKAHYRRRYYNNVNNTITIYAADGTTPEFIFDANADMSDIGPNNFTPD
jgi:hypothetical protein